MKISDIKIGTKILVPCSECHYKRSIVFQGASAYERQKKRVCSSCRAANGDYGGRLLNGPTHKKSGRVAFEDMD